MPGQHPLPVSVPDIRYPLSVRTRGMAEKEFHHRGRVFQPVGMMTATRLPDKFD